MIPTKIDVEVESLNKILPFVFVLGFAYGSYFIISKPFGFPLVYTVLGGAIFGILVYVFRFKIIIPFKYINLKINKFRIYIMTKLPKGNKGLR